jgi:hypothetical protein
MIFDVPGDAGVSTIHEMVKHLQALPVDAGDLPDVHTKKLENMSWEDEVTGQIVEKVQLNFFQTGAGAVSASAEYFRPGEVIPFHARGYTLSCAPGSNLGWYGVIAAAGIGAFLLGQQ